MLGATAIFTLGSGICGGATSSGMLIAGRGIQGAGSGGMVMISGQSKSPHYSEIKGQLAK